MISKIAKINSCSLRYMFYRMYTERAKTMLMFVCGILSFPLAVFAFSIEDKAFGNTMEPGAENVIMFCAALAIFAVVVFALLVYSSGVSYYDYYVKREKVDMNYSLPLTNRQRFWSDFAAGIIPVVINYLFAVIFGLISFMLFMDVDEYANLLISVMLIGLISVISLYILVVFCACLCGKTSTALIYPVIICMVIPAAILLIGNLIFGRIWQIDSETTILTLMTATSPGGFLIGSIEGTMSTPNIFDVSTTLPDYLFFLSPKIIIPFVIINAAFLTGGYFLSKKRLAENTGKPFAVKRASVIMTSLLMFCITAAFVLQMMWREQGESLGGLYLGLFITTIIAFLIFDVSANAGASMGKLTSRKLARMALRYVVTVGCSLLISWLLVFSNGFGLGEYVPPINKIKSIELNISAFDGDSIIDLSAIMRETTTTFKDKDSFEIIRAVHTESNKRDIEDIKTVHLGGSKIWTRQTITYTLTGGRKVERYIYLPRDSEDLLRLAAGGDYKRDVIEKIERMFENEGDTTYRLHIYDIENNRMLPRELFPEDRYGILYVTIPTEDAKTLFEAFKADYMAETYEQKYFTTDQIRGAISFGTFELLADMRIRQHYTNFLAEIEKQEYETFYATPAEFYLSKNLHIFATPKTAAWSSSPIPSAFYRDKSPKIAQLTDELLKVIQPSYLINDTGYVFKVGGIEYVIPPQYNYLAEGLIQWTVDN